MSWQTGGPNYIEYATDIRQSSAHPVHFGIPDMLVNSIAEHSKGNGDEYRGQISYFLTRCKNYGRSGQNVWVDFWSTAWDKTCDVLLVFFFSFSEIATTTTVRDWVWAGWKMKLKFQLGRNPDADRHGYDNTDVHFIYSAASATI